MEKNQMRKLRCALLICLGISNSAVFAGTSEALKALEQKNYGEAHRQASEAAAQGDGRGNYLLGMMYLYGWGMTSDPDAAQKQFWWAANRKQAVAHARLSEMYWRGQGVSKDSEKALMHAREAMAAGIRDGGFLVYLIHTKEHLNYLTPQGQPDQKRYMTLATRPLTERNIDQEAKDALYWSADKGYPLAMNMLALGLGATLGDDNQQRLLQLSERLRQGALPAVKQYAQIARYQKSLGDSYASPQLFKDTLTSQMLAAKIKLCGLKPDNADKPEMPKLLSIRRRGEISNPVYLPSRFSEYGTASLIGGEWQEIWSFEACGRQGEQTVYFKADGLGGATTVTKPFTIRPEAEPKPEGFDRN